jgi:hypothetical protein
MDSDEEYEQQKKKEREETEKEEEEEKNGPWKGVCFDDGTGRNIVYYDFKTKTVSNLRNYSYFFNQVYFRKRGIPHQTM